MFVEEIKTYNFRNLENRSITLPNGPVYLIGDNGNGKTNLLEAIAFASTTRSFRTNINSELVSLLSENKETSVFVRVKNIDGLSELGVVFANNKKEVSINGQRTKNQEDFIGRLKSVLFSPNDLAIVQGGPAERRNFIDKHLVDQRKSALRKMVDYQRILQSKNALLKQDKVNTEELESWNRLQADASVMLTTIRKAFLKELEPVASSIYAQFASEDGELSLELAPSLETEDPQEAFDRLMSYREREIARGMASLGAHKDDIIITIGKRGARSYASQGQARSITVALTMGVVRLIETATQEPILLLLDDLDSELDQGRSSYLLQTILSETRQTIITGTEARLNTELAKQTAVFKVQKGSLSSFT